MTSIRQGAAGVLAGMLAGVLSAYGAEVTISGSAGTSGTVSFNGGAPFQTVQISVEEGTCVNVVAAADDEHAFSHWTGDVDAVCEGGALQSNIVVQARAGLSLTAVFGLRNRLDSGDLRPHGYMNRFTQKGDGSWSVAWTDGSWAMNPTWWLDGYVPTNQNDVLHFQNWQQPDSLFHAWIDWPSGDWTLGTIADSSPQSKFNLASGWGHYLYIQNQENSHARWQHEVNNMGGFGTTDANTPHRVNRVWAATALGINTAKADHELIIHELSGGGYVRKVGPGRLTLEQPSAGGLRLEQGCVDLGIADAEAGYVPGAYGQYDAAATDTMTWAVAPDGKERLTVWKDANGTRDRYGNAVRLTAPYKIEQRDGPTPGTVLSEGRRRCAAFRFLTSVPTPTAPRQTTAARLWTIPTIPENRRCWEWARASMSAVPTKTCARSSWRSSFRRGAARKARSPIGTGGIVVRARWSSRQVETA